MKYLLAVFGLLLLGLAFGVLASRLEAAPVEREAGALVAASPSAAAAESLSPGKEESASVPDSLVPRAGADSSATAAEESDGLIRSLRRKIRTARAVINAVLMLIDHELGRLCCVVQVD